MASYENYKCMACRMNGASLEQAKASGLRVFYDRASDTMRLCPEDVPIAMRSADGWVIAGGEAEFATMYWRIDHALKTTKGATVMDVAAALNALYADP